MARNHARIVTSIWRKEDWRALTPEAQRMYFVALSQPTLSYCGVVAFTARRWSSMAKGLTVSKVNAAVVELARTRFVVVDADTEELWVRSFVNYDGVLEQPGLITAMAKDFLAVQSGDIRGQFLDRLGPDWLGTLPGRFPKAFGDGFPDGFPSGFADEYGEHFASMSAHARPSSPLPTPTPRPHPPAEPAGGNGNSGHAAMDDDDPHSAIRQGAYALLAARRLAAREAEKGRVGDTSAWLREATHRIVDEHHVAAISHQRNRPTVTAEQLANLLEPPAALPPADASVAAAYALARRNEAERCPVHGRLDPDDPLPDCPRCRAVVGAGR